MPGKELSANFFEESPWTSLQQWFFLDYKIDISFVVRIIVIRELPKTNHSCKYVSGAANENIVQNHLNIALLNVFQYFKR